MNSKFLSNNHKVLPLLCAIIACSLSACQNAPQPKYSMQTSSEMGPTVYGQVGIEATYHDYAKNFQKKKKLNNN